MSSTHAAVFLDAVNKPFRIGDIETKQPTKNEVLIRVHALAINPVDWKVQDQGWFIDSWPAILGEDISGTIEAIGPDVTQKFTVGQRVLAHPHFLMTKNLHQAGFQALVLVPEVSVVPLPDGMAFENATVLPLALSTAAAGLYLPKTEACLGLPLPTAQPSKNTGKVVLIWGGSSSVGTAAIQLAVASGVRVVTTCSKRNFGLVQKLGADKVFDYNSLSIVGDLVEELQNGEFVGGFDTIGSRESGMQASMVIGQLGGGVLANVLSPPEDIPATVNSKMLFALAIFYGNGARVGRAVYQDFLPQALKTGQLVPAPEAEIVGKGLQDVQEACQKQKAGVSAKKIVLTV